MSKIQKKHINHLAELARLDLASNEKDLFSRQLSAILDHVDQLKKVSVEGVEPISQITSLENVLRDDGDNIAVETLKRSEGLKNVADQQDGYVKMRSIF